jgi:enoyl-CoA hydratase
VDDYEILFERRGPAGIITLNRPRTLNAVTHTMVRQLAARLGDWARDGDVSRVIIMSSSERAFSAGGDVRFLYELGQTGRHAEALRFWRDEYTLNTVIKRYPKPYIALMDGITMGGGAGISIHGSHRIAGDRFQFAMPEVGIGFFPDVGATWFMSRMPGEIGTYFALTGERLKAADSIASGIVTHYVPSARWRELVAALTDSRVSIETAMAELAQPLDPGPVLSNQYAIDRMFAYDYVEDILGALDRETISGSRDAGWAGATAALIRAKSPTSLKIALEQLRRGKHMSFSDCMRVEFRIVSRVVHSHEFYEGVRAVIIDKDQRPNWKPAQLTDISDQYIDTYFEELGDAELAVP